MQFRRQLTTEDSINITPLIDVVFLLLIFFMVSTTFIEETHLSVDLPEASKESTIISSGDGIDIVVDASGNYSINGRSVANKQERTLYRALAEVAQGNNQQALVITADANAPHQAVVTAMDVAGRQGFSQLKIATKEPVQQ